MRVTLVDVAQVWDQAVPLMQLNWAETGFDFKLDPKLEFYQAMQQHGTWFAVAAFDGESLIGYSSEFLSPHPFNPSVVAGMSEALFVRKECRGVCGARLIRATEDEAKRRGATWQTWHTRAGTRLAQSFERRGYIPADAVVMRRL